MLIPFLILVLILVLLLVFSSLQKNENSLFRSFLRKFQTAFEEDVITKQWSSNRVAFLYTVFLSNLIVWSGVFYLLIKNGSFPYIPEGIIFLYGIANGIASATKVWQKREERLSSKLEEKDIEIEDSEKLNNK